MFNNLVSLRWVQEAAISHWRVLASAEEQASVAWVVHRHEIDYLRPAFVGEGITLWTWVGVATPATFERLTELVREADGFRRRAEPVAGPMGTTSPTGRCWRGRARCGVRSTR